MSSSWRFTGNDGKPWKATIQFVGGGEPASEVKATLSVSRAG